MHGLWLRSARMGVKSVSTIGAGPLDWWPRRLFSWCYGRFRWRVSASRRIGCWRVLGAVASVNFAGLSGKEFLYQPLQSGLERLECSDLSKDSLISRLTLTFASSQTALRMNAQKRLLLANNFDSA